MKSAQWYYKQLDKLELKLKECEKEDVRKQIEKEIDKLHDELYKLEN